MIRHTNDEPILGVEYEMVFGGEILDIVGSEQGGMKEVLRRVEANPGMTVVARVFHNLGESEDYRQDIIERRDVVVA